VGRNAVLFKELTEMTVVEVDKEGREDGVCGDEEETIKQETLEVERECVKCRLVLFEEVEGSYIGNKSCEEHIYHKNHHHFRASMVFKIIQCFLKNKRPNLFEFGQQERDWVYIKDVVQANILGMKIPAGIYNCGYGESREFNEVLHIINGFKLKSKKFIANYIRNPYPENYQSTTNINIDKLKNQGYKPVYNLEKGIKDIIL
jgi:hypothetical protein